MAQIKAKSLREFFTSPRRWCQGVPSDGQGRYCLYGAIRKVYEKKGGGADFKAIDRIRAVLGHWNIAAFNDASTTTFADIQRVVRKARV